MDQFDVVVLGFLVSLSKAAVSVIMFSTITFILLRLADRISGIRFSDEFGVVSSDAKALAFYLSARYAVLGLGNAYIIASNFMY